MTSTEITRRVVTEQTATPDEVRRTARVVHTWADGFGVWHARVSRSAAWPLGAARRAIRDELQSRAPRGETVPRRVWVPLVVVDDLSDETTVVYREPNTDPADNA